MPPPLIVTPAARARDRLRPPVWLSSSWPGVKRIVWAVANTVGSNVIVWAPFRTSARSTAPRRSSLPGWLPLPSAVVFTTSLPVEGWVWKAPMSIGLSSGKPRWSVVTPLTATPLPMAGLPGEQGHGLGRPAVECQRGQAQVRSGCQDDVAVLPLTSPPEPPVPIRL